MPNLMAVTLVHELRALLRHSPPVGARQRPTDVAMGTPATAEFEPPIQRTVQVLALPLSLELDEEQMATCTARSPEHGSADRR